MKRLFCALISAMLLLTLLTGVGASATPRDDIGVFLGTINVNLGDYFS